MLVCRYDKLVGMFSSKDVPAVGVSVGIERVFNLLEDKIMAGCKDESGAVCGKIRETDTEVTDLTLRLQDSQCCLILSIDTSAWRLLQIAFAMSACWMRTG